jgi:flagellar biosynthesis/type III secretory pathway chaperone
MINRLIDIIGREAALFESFLELLERQKQMLVTNDVEGLSEVTEQQRRKLIESRLLNRQREELAAQIKESHALDGDVTVSRLLQLADRDQADRLRALRDSILGLNEKITQTRNSNALLLNQSREYISNTIKMLTQIRSPQPTYVKSGVNGDRASNSMLDRRA